MKTLIKAMLTVVTVGYSAMSLSQVAVVVGAKSAATALNAEQVAGLFLGKSDHLPGVGTGLLLDQPESSPTRELFYTKVTGKSSAQVKATWSRLVFSGQGVPPKMIENSEAVKKTVTTHPNALGYIEKSAVDSTVKVLLTVD
jgi:ABC-type phosphate transport system substrate-binding protein